MPKGKKKKTTGLSLQHLKTENFSAWYNEIIYKAELIDEYDISGCFILRPYSYAIWETIQGWFDAEIKKLGVRNAYFPCFVTEAALCKEEDHIEGFAPEVAWVTQYGTSDLAKRIAIRPTSETIMYPAFAKWIRSHRDLPLRLNQWTNVVRWEFKQATPFIRTREFLWQEGHSAFATAEEADVEVFDILDLYARVYEELLAVPVIKGRKSEKEKFAGGRYTTTVEAFIAANGRAVQGATSHSLGQNFAHMFGITFEGEDGSSAGAKKKHVWQNSWGLTTRSIGVMVMVHGDNKGLVMPPRVAPTQVVIVPIPKGKDGYAELAEVSEKIRDELVAAGVRVEWDNRTNYNPGWKYAHWEQRGVPLRLEIGARDLAKGSVVLVRRDTGEKASIAIDEVAGALVGEDGLLNTIHNAMLAKARAERDSRLGIAYTWDEFMVELTKGNMVLAPWCEMQDTEEWVKEQTRETENAADGAVVAVAAEGGAAPEVDEDAGKGAALTGAAKTLCIPFSQNPIPEGTLCFTSVAGSPGEGKLATSWALWGRSY